MSDTLNRLAEVLEERKQAAPDSSYVASLYHKGLNKICLLYTSPSPRDS